MTRTVRFILILSLLCSQAYATDSLRFIGDVNFKTGTKFLETEIGGLSGITFDKQQNKMLAVSDDRAWVSETRFYEFDLTLSQNAFTVTPSKVVKLKKADGTYFQKGEADFEGISLYNGDVLISSEGIRKFLKPSSSMLYRFSRNGDFKELITVPEKQVKPMHPAPEIIKDSKRFLQLLMARPRCWVQKTLFFRMVSYLISQMPLPHVLSSMII